MKKAFIYLLVCFFAVLLCSCGTHRPYYADDVEDWQKYNPDTMNLLYSVYLVGDAGESDENPLEGSLTLLQHKIYSKFDTIIRVKQDTTAVLGDADPGDVPQIEVVKESNPKDILVFLGDNIYQHGLPPVGADDRPKAEKRLLTQLTAIEQFQGLKFFVPGNHDWNYQGRQGLEYIMRQEDYIEEFFDGEDIMQPSNGCPGPIEYPVNDNLVLVFIDSQWWLHKFEKPRAPENGCTVEDDLDLIIQLDDILERNKNKSVLIMMHHPLISNGNHGGRYSIKDFIFPLRLINNDYWIPLPGLGSLYPLMRKYGISRQDIPNPEYQKLKNAVMTTIADHDFAMVAAGHDHNLQLHQEDNNYYIISGGGCKQNHAARGLGADYVHTTNGFSILRYYDNGQVWIEFWEESTPDNPEGKMTFRKPLYSIPPDLPEPEAIEDVPACGDSLQIIAAGPEYKASGIRKLFFGEHWREAWATPVKVCWLDLGAKAGGLEPIKKGGGKQTLSLRLMGKNNVQYQLRSINKDPAAVLPAGLQKTFVEEIFQDQISSGHPYGAFVLPGMAEELGLLHTNPELYYVPTTPLLGAYVDDFGDMLAMMEIRPDENLSQFKRFGYSKNVVSTNTMFRHLREDNDNSMDQELYLKTRLFDMLIGDWDRHEDQYRWSEIEKDEKGSVFKPVPRDRDQAFFKFDGFFPWLISRRWGVLGLENFGYDINDVRSLNNSARHLDRRLLNDLSREEWIKIANDIQMELTDDEIRNSVMLMPPEIYEITGNEITNKLISRREQIVAAAVDYYELLAKEVDIPGSEKHEFFQVERLNDEETRVRVYKKKKEGELKILIFDRTFYRNETDEIRLYGLGGIDSFMVSGQVNKGILVRIIPGDGEDVVIDQSKVGGLCKKSIVYEYTEDANHIVRGGETKLKRSDDPEMAWYDYDVFEYNRIQPKIGLEYNVDDGIFFKAGLIRRTHAFRKEPFATKQSLMAGYAIKTQGLQIEYEGYFTNFFGKKNDLYIDAEAWEPRFVLNYFGQGNETERGLAEIDYYRTRISGVEVTPYFRRRFTDFFEIGVGPMYEYKMVEPKAGTFLTSESFSDDEDVNRPFTYTGSRFYTLIDLRDDKMNPNRGIYLRNEWNYYYPLNSDRGMFSNLNFDMSFYVTPNLPFQLTVATRFGGETNIGDYRFFQSAFLGGNSNLRGYRRTRFAGQSSLFNNTEARLEIGNFRNFVWSGNWGVHGFIDVGRVWAPGEISERWHSGYGPGVWIYLYRLMMVSGSFGFSPEGKYLTVEAGFRF